MVGYVNLDQSNSTAYSCKQDLPDKAARARNVVDDLLNRRDKPHREARVSGRDSDIRYNIMMLRKTISRRLFGTNRGLVAVLRITKALRADLSGWKTFFKDRVAYIYYATSQMGKSGIVESMPLGTQYVAVSLRQHQGVFPRCLPGWVSRIKSGLAIRNVFSTNTWCPRRTPAGLMTHFARALGDFATSSDLERRVFLPLLEVQGAAAVGIVAVELAPPAMTAI